MQPPGPFLSALSLSLSLALALFRLCGGLGPQPWAAALLASLFQLGQQRGNFSVTNKLEWKAKSEGTGSVKFPPALLSLPPSLPPHQTCSKGSRERNLVLSNYFFCFYVALSLSLSLLLACLHACSARSLSLSLSLSLSFSLHLFTCSAPTNTKRRVPRAHSCSHEVAQSARGNPASERLSLARLGPPRST